MGRLSPLASLERTLAPKMVTLASATPVWAVGLDAEQQLWVMKDDKPIVVFSADYTRELYMALAAVFADNRAS